MVRGGGYMEAEKRIDEMSYSWCVNRINKLVNVTLVKIAKDESLTIEDRQKQSLEIEKAWIRILRG